MPIGPETLIPVGGMIAAWVLTRKKKKRRRRPRECPPFSPVDIDAVISTAQAGVQQGLVGVARVSSYVGGVLYPVDHNGVSIPWPKDAPFELPPDTPEPIICLFAEIMTIVSDLDIPDEPIEGPQTPGEILTNLISATPTDGKFFQVYHKGPNGGNVARKVLNKIVHGAGSDGQNRRILLRLMTTPDTWNVNLYSRDKFTSGWQAYVGVDGVNIGTAWLPRNKKASSAIIQGKMPTRNIDIHGAKIGPGASYGLVWIPPLNAEMLKAGVVSVGDGKWSDGSSVLNPPPELLNLLT